MEGQVKGAKKKEEASQVFPPPHLPFRGSPASLTEGGWPVVCWPVYIIPAAGKKFRGNRKKSSRIAVEEWPLWWGIPSAWHILLHLALITYCVFYKLGKLQRLQMRSRPASIWGSRIDARFSKCFPSSKNAAPSRNCPVADTVSRNAKQSPQGKMEAAALQAFSPRLARRLR